MVASEKEGAENTYILSVVLDTDEVGVDFGEDGETVETVVFTGTNPTFKLKECVRKGLYYGIAMIDDQTSESPTMTIKAEQQATSNGQEISLTPVLDFGSSNVLYFKWSVSDTQQIATP